MTEISPTKSSESARPVVLVCQCSDAQVTETAATERLVAVLGKRDATVNVVSDLCELAALNPDALRALATTGPVWVVACHRRAVGEGAWACERPMVDG